MEVYMYIPSGNFLKPFTLGFNQLIADYFWIKTIGYFGEHLMSDRNYPWLYQILDLVTNLDPHFIWPYYFGGITLSLEAQQVKQSNLILKKAIHYYPDNWKFPFFLGFNYWYHTQELSKAAFYLQCAAQKPNAPRYLKTLPARLLSAAGQKEAALYFLFEMKRNTQNSLMKEQIEKRIQEILQGTLKGPQKPKPKLR
ncbi:MAG: hypothetical protein OS130_12255 [Thermodesulfobacteriota bacterium]|nr:MAG: hypothetical protein OS130_12255 [Thermodesulfobacteriota bacterium]